MGRLIDITGLKFNRLTVLKKIKGSNLWECVCDCGNKTKTMNFPLRTGKTKSCGCLLKERGVQRMTKHGFSRTPEYGIWQNAKWRCTNPKRRDFKNYGGRGIKMCNEWLNSFESFIYHVGFRKNKNYSLDRIDVNGNYEPGNVRWVLIKEQLNNKRNNRLISWNGITRSVSQWAKSTGISRPTIQSRLERGFKSDDIFSTSNLRPGCGYKKVRVS